MPVYHSSFFNDEDFKQACKMPLVPLKDGNDRWPYEDDQDDIVEEAIKSFRANCLFKSFDIRSNADRLLIYLTLFTLQCIKKCYRNAKTKKEAGKVLNILGQDRKFPLPGEAKFLMPNALVGKANDAAELDKAKSLLFRCRRWVVRVCLGSGGGGGSCARGSA